MRSWTGEYPWNATDEKLYEYACHEGNYSLGGMLRGARAEGSRRRGGEDRAEAIAVSADGGVSDRGHGSARVAAS